MLLQHSTSCHCILPSHASTAHIQCMLQRLQIKTKEAACYNPSSSLYISNIIMLYFILALQKSINECACSGGHHYTPLSPEPLHFHEQTPSLFPYNTSLYNAIYSSQLFQNFGVLFFWLKTPPSNTNIPCCQPFLTIFKSLLISFGYKHTLEKFPQ